MKRENVLWAVAGLLAGFAVGYFVHDMVTDRQSPPMADFHGAMGGGGLPGAGMEGHPPMGGGMDDVARLREQVEQNPADAEAVLRLANMNYDIQNWQRAADLYARYLELRPDDPNALTDLGVAYRGLGEHSRALESFDRAHEVDPQQWQALFNKVVLQAFELRDLDAARETLAVLEAQEPGNAEVERLAREVSRLE